jgi:hypothetical protein
VSIFHPFLATLKEWERGLPVDCRAHREGATIKVVVAKGAHKSATTNKSIVLIAEDVAYQITAGYAQIIMWEKLCQTRPKNLKVSPLAVVPQRNCRGRMILDFLFPVRCERTLRGQKRSIQDKESLQPLVNNTTA